MYACCCITQTVGCSCSDGEWRSMTHCMTQPVGCCWWKVEIDDVTTKHSETKLDVDNVLGDMTIISTTL
jgi:hypothetical protein